MMFVVNHVGVRPLFVLSLLLAAIGCRSGASGAFECINDGDCPPGCSCDADFVAVGICESDTTANECGGGCDRESTCPPGTECLFDRAEGEVDFYECLASNGGTGGVGGHGGAGGSGGTGGVDRCAGVDCDDSSECTINETCDTTTGQCTNSFVENGTSCDGDQGTCLDGECILVNLDGCGSPSARYEDGDFAPGVWVSTKVDEVSQGTTSIAAITTEPTGGNPGAFHRVEVRLTATEDQVAVIWVAHALEGAVYDPGTEGEICGVRLFLDGTDQYDPIVGHRAIFSVFLLQDGTYYWGERLNVSSDSWERGAWTTEDFVKFAGEGPNLPDFTASGEPIQLGYFTGNSRPTTAPGSGMPIAAADNFKAEIFPPAP